MFDMTSLIATHPLIFIIYCLPVIYSPSPLSLCLFFHTIIPSCAVETAEQSEKQAKDLEQAVAHLLNIFL